jgi:hypothetical protein
MKIIIPIRDGLALFDLKQHTSKRARKSSHGNNISSPCRAQHLFTNSGCRTVMQRSQQDQIYVEGRGRDDSYQQIFLRNWQC